MITLPDKSPGDVLDYQVDFINLIPPTFNLDSASVQLLNSAQESPDTLSVVSHNIQPSFSDINRNTTVLFWLSGGTPGIRYRGKITVSDNESTSPDREIVRLFEIKVRDI